MGKVINGKTEEQINIEKQEENAASIASLTHFTDTSTGKEYVWYVDIQNGELGIVVEEVA